MPYFEDGFGLQEELEQDLQMHVDNFKQMMYLWHDENERWAVINGDVTKVRIYDLDPMHIYDERDDVQHGYTHTLGWMPNGGWYVNSKTIARPRHDGLPRGLWAMLCEKFSRQVHMKLSFLDLMRAGMHMGMPMTVGSPMHVSADLREALVTDREYLRGLTHTTIRRQMFLGADMIEAIHTSISYDAHMLWNVMESRAAQVLPIRTNQGEIVINPGKMFGINNSCTIEHPLFEPFMNDMQAMRLRHQAEMLRMLNTYMNRVVNMHMRIHDCNQEAAKAMNVENMRAVVFEREMLAEAHTHEQRRAQYVLPIPQTHTSHDDVRVTEWLDWHADQYLHMHDYYRARAYENWIDREFAHCDDLKVIEHLEGMRDRLSEVDNSGSLELRRTTVPGRSRPYDPVQIRRDNRVSELIELDNHKLENL